MPALSPSASRERRAQRERGVLHRVVRVDLQVALGAHGQVEAAVPGELVEHVVVEADAGGDLGLAGAVEVDLDEDLGLLGDPLDPRGAGSSAALHRGQERVGLLRRARGDPQPAGQADVADQHAPVEQRLPGRLLVAANRPKSTKLASLSATRQPALAQRRRRSGRAAP